MNTQKSDTISFIQNVSTLLTGSAIAQLISIVGLIVLQRFFYGPEDFAPFRLFFEYVAIFVGISSLRLDSAIVLEQDSKNAKALALICFKLIGITAIISLITFYIYASFTKNFNSISNQIELLLLIPLSVITLGSLQVFNSWFTRLEKFKLMSINKVFQSTMSTSTQLFLGIINFNFIGLILGRFFGTIGANIIFFKNFCKSVIDTKVDFSFQKRLVVKHKKFVYYTSPGFFVGNLINFVFLALFVELYGNNFGGKIAASVQYLGISIAIISSSFSQVYFSKISKLKTKAELKSTYSYWSLRLSIVSVFGVILIHFIPDSWVTFLLGNQWVGLIEIMKIMAIWMSIMFISSSLSYIYIKLGRQKETLIFDFIHLFLASGAIYFAHSRFSDAIISLWAFTIVQCIFYTFAIIVAYYFISKFKEDLE